MTKLVTCAGSMPEIHAATISATTYDDMVVNCDMLQHDHSGHTIKVVAYGKRYFLTPAGTATPEAYVYAEDWAGHNLTFSLGPGKSLMSGRLPDNGIVDVPDLPRGLYLLNVSKKDAAPQRFKFTKE